MIRFMQNTSSMWCCWLNKTKTNDDASWGSSKIVESHFIFPMQDEIFMYDECSSNKKKTNDFSQGKRQTKYSQPKKEKEKKTSVKNQTPNANVAGVSGGSVASRREGDHEMNLGSSWQLGLLSSLQNAVDGPGPIAVSEPSHVHPSTLVPSGIREPPKLESSAVY